MRLHRLMLTNYRGITHRDIDFPESGVTVISGPNEVGKSSMIEAIDLLFESKDRSSKRDVKQVKPTHADVGSEVTAEISTGPYRFVYRKRFHKMCVTELTVLAPHREQITGDEAHERVRAMLAETVDTGLWLAQRVLQSASTSAVDLSGCDALSRALDVAAADSGQVSELSGTEPLLLEKIDVEYSRYFTGTGRPTGEWAASTAALRTAEAEVAHCEALVTEVDDRVLRHAELTRELAELEEGGDAVTARLEAAEAAAGKVDALSNELRAAQTEAEAAAATSAAAAMGQRERLRLRAEADHRATALAEAEAAEASTVAAVAEGREILDACERAVSLADITVRDARARAEAARRTVTELCEMAEVQRLTTRLTRIEDTRRELEVIADRLREIPLREGALRGIEAAVAAVELAQAQVEAAAPTVEFTAEADVELIVGRTRITVPAGKAHRLTVSDAVAIRMPGVGTAEIKPGATAADTRAKLAAAQRSLAGVLAGAGLADVGEARRLDHIRVQSLSRRDRLTATLAGLLGDDELHVLYERLQALNDRLAQATGSSLDSGAAQAGLERAESEVKEATASCEVQRRLACAAHEQYVERSTRAAVQRDRSHTARSECAAVASRLAAQRASVADDDLAVQAAVAAERAAHADNRVVTVSAQLAAWAPEEVKARLASADAAACSLADRCAEIEHMLHAIAVELALIGTEGRADKLDAALARREHAAAQHARVQRRAHGARLLRDVMARHRETTRAGYVEPFQAELERLGRLVFGASFQIEVDSDLRISNRTLDGRTVPFGSLSGGAKEQLGIVARLAVAGLVAKEDSVPVMIDDALGMTDPDRLAKMAGVFDAVGSHGQVIVLTCQPERYRAVVGAHTIVLTA